MGVHTQSWPSALAWRRVQCRLSYRLSLWVVLFRFLCAHGHDVPWTVRKSLGSSLDSWLWECSSLHAAEPLQWPLILSGLPSPACPVNLAPSDDVSFAASFSLKRSWKTMTTTKRMRRMMMSCSSLGDWGPVPGHWDHLHSFGAKGEGERYNN